MMKPIALFGLALIFGAGLNGCVSYNYKSGVPVPNTKDQYTFRVGYNVFASGWDSIKKRLKPTITKFMQEHSYGSYEIVNSSCGTLWLTCRFTVHFSHERKELPNDLRNESLRSLRELRNRGVITNTEYNEKAQQLSEVPDD